MTAADNPEQFREQWESYIDSFDRLKLALDPEKWDELEEAQDEIRFLVHEAVSE